MYIPDPGLCTPSSKSLGPSSSTLRFAAAASDDDHEDYNHQNSVRFCFNVNQRTFSTESDGSAPRSLDDRQPPPPPPALVVTAASGGANEHDSSDQGTPK